MSPWRAARKITVEIPADLLEKAQRASGAGITQTIRTGLKARGCIRDLCPATPASRQGALLAHAGRSEGRSMIAADTSTWIAFLQQGAAHVRPSEDTSLLDRALEDRQVVMVPAVLDRTAKRSQTSRGRRRNTRRYTDDRPRTRLLAAHRASASKGISEASQGTTGRRADCSELPGLRSSTSNARRRLPRVCRSRRARPRSSGRKQAVLAAAQSHEHANP